MFEEYFNGLATKKLKQLTNPKFTGNYIICFYTDFDNFTDMCFKHYLSIGC